MAKVEPLVVAEIAADACHPGGTDPACRKVCPAEPQWAVAYFGPQVAVWVMTGGCSQSRTSPGSSARCQIRCMVASYSSNGSIPAAALRAAKQSRS